VPEKVFFYTAFAKWLNFFKFSGYFGRKGSKKSGNSGKKSISNQTKPLHAA
jgi:hypothetical protein